MSETPIQDRRDALMQAATDLTKALRDVAKPVNEVVARLVSEADGLMLRAADEKDQAGKPKVQAVTYDKPTLGPYTMTKGQTIPNLPLPQPAPAGKRACSLCRSLEPYPHRAKNCPNAHIMQGLDMANKALKALKKRRKS